ncbi:MAG: radical SAM/SPASM domain-containing protein [Candidatus Gastranaerophilales bacterium]|nr:radical SAM/SPASM domain-containing protein [Candidatus Gastranaerophilales bacterium]
MTAKFEMPISKDRKPLHTLLPLNTPLTVYIDPSTICNFSCAFCYNNTEFKKQVDAKIMSWELFTKIVEDLKEFEQKIKMIHMYGYGEPLINKNFPKMVKAIKDANVAEKVGMTTNASLLTHEISDRIIASGLDKIEISIYGMSNEKYMEFSHQNVHFDKIVENIKYLFDNRKNCHIHVKINGDYFTQEEKELFKNIFENSCDSMHIDNAANIWPGIDLNDKIKTETSSVYGKNDTKIAKICPDVFYKLMINSNGNVGVCCVDYLQKVYMGNVKDKSLKEIWNSNELRELRLAHLNENLKQYPICSICNYPSCASTVSVDEYKQELIAKYQ